MKKILLVLILLSIGTASAQDIINYPVPATTNLIWTHDGIDLTGFKLILDGVTTDLGTTVIHAAGTMLYSIPFPSVTPGNHIIVILAYNSAGNSPNSDEFQFVVSVGIPTRVTNIRIEKTIK